MTATAIPQPRPLAAPSREPRIEADFSIPGDFPLDAGGVLHQPTLRYALYGQPLTGDNAVLVCHALSGSARVADWWPALFEPGGLLDPHRDCILGINILGSCYGSTGPSSPNPATGRIYGPDFPLVSIRDIVRAQALLLDSLGIQKIKLALGASIGGMQVLEWCVQHPPRIERAIAIGAAPLNAFGLALNHMQRQAIRLDPAWQNGAYSPDHPPLAGLSLARQLASCSYKSPDLFDDRFARRPNRAGDDPYLDQGLNSEGRFDIAGYLDYQGSRFNDRFDARSYVAITRTMDLFNLDTFDPGTLPRAQADITLVGISSDLLFPAADVRALAARFPHAQYRELTSTHGHDAFLAEPEHLIALLQDAAPSNPGAAPQ